MLADLIKHTDDSHPDKPVLEDTLKQISDLAENVNGDMRRQENLQKQLKLQRAFVGTVVKQTQTLKHTLKTPKQHKLHTHFFFKRSTELCELRQDSAQRMAADEEGPLRVE